MFARIGLKYLLVMALLLSGVAMALLAYAPPMSEWPPFVGGTFIVIVLTYFALVSQKWTVLVAVLLLLVVSTLGRRWRVLLAIVVLANWTAIHLLNYVSDIGDWPFDLFKAFWLALFSLALIAPFLGRWREFATYCLMLFITFGAFTVALFAPERGWVLPNRWLQETGFHIYASHLIRSVPHQEFLSGCKLVDYIEEDGSRRQVGECDDGLRSTLWFQIAVIHDPSGQIALPAIQRTLEWRLAVLHLPNGRFFVHDDKVAKHLDGSFYWMLAPPDLTGGDRK